MLTSSHQPTNNQQRDLMASSDFIAVSVNGGLMQLNCFASAQEPGIPNSSLILCASFIRCLVMRERVWEREQHVSYASRRSACGGNSLSSAGQEWRPRSPGEARRQWNSCSLRGGWLTHTSAGRWNLGMAAGRWRREGGGLAKVPCKGPTDGNYQDDFPQMQDGGQHISKNISDLMNSMSTANSVFIRLLSALKTFPSSRPVWFEKHQ